ncbi:MAG TPA: HEAT repeat domain-containing protein, partial [Rhodothermales bacterium]|nr:HEAT repeat domain-containing protein [Rhodothermales bacterium]
VGPDGRIYWSIGDIGFNVVDPTGKRWAYPNQGAVLRANPDGSDFEVFAAGLRNTHEIVFDAYGNLISVDNDGDHPGEQERVVYIVNGSDSGWRINWQFGKYYDPDNNTYKVWMDEEMFKPRFEGQAAYITPPIANYHAGPAGMAYNPGTALGEAWRDRFFVAEFVGSPAGSNVYAFELQPKGASFEFVGEKVVSNGILATGLDFGPDGALYVADWLEGWGTKNRGRIWKLDVPGEATSAMRREVQTLIGEDFGDHTAEHLLELLQHADMRVRQKAQFELARRGEEGAETLLASARQTDHQLARLHGLWGLTQLYRKDFDTGDELASFLQDEDPEIRAQAAKVIGDVRYANAADALLPLLQDDAPRVRFFAAEALGRIAYPPAVQPIIDMLEANNDEDAYLRHAGALALARIGEADPIIELADHPSRALRIAAVVALRRLKNPEVARFLEDEDAFIVTEVARAINDDFSIEEALPALAQVLENPRFTNEALMRRAINANHRLGTAEAANRVATYAARPDVPEALAVEALASLGVWPKPSLHDRVDGRYRDLGTRDPAIAKAAVAEVIEPLLLNGSSAVKVAAAETAGRLTYGAVAPTLARLVRQDAAPEVRAAALQALHATGYSELDVVIEDALADTDPEVRMTALTLVPELDLSDDRTATLLASVLGRTTMEEQQAALQTLGTLQTTEANAVLEAQLDQLVAGTLRPEIQLDVMEAVDSSGSAPLTTRLEQYREARPDDDLVAVYREALEGGDPREGAQIFYRNESAQCVRCHAVGDYGGGVGPNLLGIGSVLSREQLLESLVDPSARIAPGYGIETVTLENGQTLSGTVRQETASQLIMLVDEEERRIDKAEIAQRQHAPSSMPPMGSVLTRRQLRDLVAFLVAQE